MKSGFLTFVITGLLADSFHTFAGSNSAVSENSGTYYKTLPDSFSFSATNTAANITVDGVLDEDEWNLSESITGFRQFEPVEGAPSTGLTSVRILFGENSLYVGASFHDEQGPVEHALGRRDEYNRADWFLVSIDSYFNRRNAYTFGVSAAGVQLDGQRTGSAMIDDMEEGSAPELPPGLDISWDAIWYSSVKINPGGWVAEIRIPYSMLRFPDTDSQTWGIHFTRRIARLGEIAEWPMVPRTERINLVARFGQIAGIKDLKPRRNIQIRPYILGSVNTSESSTRPGKTSYNSRFDFGGDLKIGLGPNVMMDVTINPDFGQIESDPAVLNLTAFETIYPEKRQFFIEGADIFRFSLGPGSMFYSRRIGANEPIIAAAKVSGRTAKGLSFGVLGASTGDDFNPVRNYAIGRMNQQLGKFSSFGGMVSMLFNTPDIETDRLTSFTGGMDWDLRNKKNTYGMIGLIGMSWRDPRAPGFKPSTGFTSRFEFSKRQGIINGMIAFLVFSDKFNPNDLGSLQESNFYEAMTNINYEIKGGKSFSVFQRATANIFMLQRYSYDNLLDLGDMINFETEWTTDNFAEIRLGSEMNNVFNGYDIYETRGLGPWYRPANIGFFAEYDTDRRKKLKFDSGVEYAKTGDGSMSALGLVTTWNVGNKLALSASIIGEMENSVLAWASNESFLKQDNTWNIGITSVVPSLLTLDEYTAFADDGLLEGILSSTKPYSTNTYFVPVFGERDTRSLDVTVRSSFSFTPNLSLQLYSQFFLARGIYENYSILVNRDDLKLFERYPKHLDFSYKSLVSNLVLRWEYRPGSTLYAVWSHGRNENNFINPLAPRGESPYNRPFGKQVEDTFGIFPDNAFIIKLSYTFL